MELMELMVQMEIRLVVGQLNRKLCSIVWGGLNKIQNQYIDDGEIGIDTDGMTISENEQSCTLLEDGSHISCEDIQCLQSVLNMTLFLCACSY